MLSVIAYKNVIGSETHLYGNQTILWKTFQIKQTRQQWYDNIVSSLNTDEHFSNKV